MLANFARVLAVSAMCLAAVGSATSNTGGSGSNLPPPGGAQANAGPTPEPPASQPMDPSRALGLWRSTFGAVKIEADNTRGGLGTGNLQGVWVYQRRGEEVVGYFSGNLHGNVFEFKWQEPNNPPLTGAGYLVFEASGKQYSGRWWSDARDRQGDWNGWRSAPPAPAGPGNPQTDPYGPPTNPQTDPNNPSPARGPNPDPYGPSPGPYGGRTYGNGSYGPQPGPSPQPYGPGPSPGPSPQPYGPGPAQPAPRGYY